MSREVGDLKGRCIEEMETLCFLFLMNEFVFYFKIWACSLVAVFPDSVPRNSVFLLLLPSILQEPWLILCFSLTEGLWVHGAFLRSCSLMCSLLCAPLPSSGTCCLRFRGCQRVPAWHAAFFSFLPVFLLIRTICVCIGRTLFKSNSEPAWLLSPKVPIISTLPTAFCQNWVLSRSLHNAYSAFWEMKLSARLVKKW